MKKILFLIIFLLFFFGCINQKLSFENKMKCIDLASYPHTTIPACESQEKCFAEVEKNFFSFNQNLFSSSVQQKLHSYKNHVALSWLYFNHSKKLLKQINTACRNESYPELPSLVNKLNHFLTSSFTQYWLRK